MNEEEYFAQAKPVYNVSRDKKGKTTVTPQNNKLVEKTLNQINEEIQNEALDNKSTILSIMITESYNQLTRIQIEIDILKKMYEMYNKEIYLKQINSYQESLQNTINRIRILKEFQKNF